MTNKTSSDKWLAKLNSKHYLVKKQIYQVVFMWLNSKIKIDYDKNRNQK